MAIAKTYLTAGLVMLFLLGAAAVGYTSWLPQSWDAPSGTQGVDDGQLVAASDQDTLAMTMLVLDRLREGENAFPAHWTGGATPDGQIEVVIVRSENDVSYAFVRPDAGETDPIMDELHQWLAGQELEGTPPHRFIEDEHTGTYTNVVLTLPDGILWMQFDADGQPTKLWLETGDPLQPSPSIA